MIECNKHIIGGIRVTDIKEFIQLTDTTPLSMVFGM